ncbi:hypothetical protein TNCV_4330911 [Trichonephila clavipes]|nr:hypothetical protein TNCV_4330911 [Trichonephila clavipes]
MLKKRRVSPSQPYPEWSTAPQHIHLQNIPYTSASVRINSISTVGSHISQQGIRHPTMLLSPHLMSQNGILVNIFRLMGNGISHMGPSLVNMRDLNARQCEFCR